MSDVERYFHETWLGMVQPVEGLVVSIPVLVEAQCFLRQPPATQQRLLELCPLTASAEDGERAIRDLPAFLVVMLDLTPDLVDAGESLPADLSLYVPEGGQTVRPTLVIRRAQGEPPAALVWDLPEGLALDRPETVTGPWEYPPAAKLDRLLRHCRVPIGILTNRTHVRLLYAPHGESTGSITFRIADMATVGGRPILDAFVMLLSATRFFGVAPERQLPAILAESRKHQANVTNELADQVLVGLGILLRGFEAAAERDGTAVLDDALARESDDGHLYGGLLTVLLRLVFLLYAEDRGLLPVENELYEGSLSLLGLFDALQEDQGAFPDSMSRRFGAWSRCVSLFRAVWIGVEHGPLRMPARRGQLFDPHVYPFLEGWGPGGSAPIVDAEARAAVRVPSVDDETVFRALEKLLVFEGQRLSYRALDVEQIGLVYEALMGYHVLRVASTAVCLRPNRVWVTAAELLEVAPARRAKWIQETAALPKSQAEKLAAAVNAATTGDEAVLAVLEGFRAKDTERARTGRLVLQPGPERRRTSSHYTPRSLTAPIVERTLGPLFATMGPTPSSERLLDLKVCDPAMGSGAFLVEACRALADRVVAAWTREGKLESVTHPGEDPVMHARRLVAQRCLYGVDRNPFAVNLAKLSLWLVTLARDLPFTFLDHALRHGDSVVGLDHEQIVSFHWKPAGQLELARKELEATLDEAITSRQRILELAAEPAPWAQYEKERLLDDAEDALDRVRLIGDLVVGAFFAGTTAKEREKERTRRLELVRAWLEDGGPAPEALRALQDELRRRIPAFHWMAEYPEVFWAKRPDPLEDGATVGKAWIDAFVGNPPFMGGSQISGTLGDAYLAWLQTVHEGAHGNADYSAHFFRRAAALLGSHGTIGLIATNTIAQGDTRLSGLKHLMARGLTIYDATRSMLWPGEAAVAVSVVHLAKGAPAGAVGDLRLDGQVAMAISSRLRPKPERPDPGRLRANADLSFLGTKVYGEGFVLSPDERERLVAKDRCNDERIFPYLGGEEVNTSPTQSFDRYVISFGQMTLAEAERWPDLLSIVREKVKPERDQLKDNPDGRRRKQYWWQFGRETPALHEAIRGLPRCLVTSVVTKHLGFTFQPTNRIFSHRLYVFPLPAFGAFGTLQSRAHDLWARLLSSSMREDLRYSTSDCFETFPFPRPDPREVIPELEDIGGRLYEARAKYMVETDQGLTQTYNRLKNPDCRDPAVVDLRRLHEDLDRAVLAAYGWSDIPVPPFVAPATDAGRQAVTAFEDEVIDRLFVLNAERAAADEALGARSTPAKAKAKRRKNSPRQKDENRLPLDPD